MFDSFVMQIAATEIAILVGVVIPLIVSGLAYIKIKSFEPSIREARDTGIYVGILATLTANKPLENKETIRDLISYIENRIDSKDPESTRKERDALIRRLSLEIKATEAQIKRITPMIPGAANADTNPVLPRESDFIVQSSSEREDHDDNGRGDENRDT